LIPSALTVVLTRDAEDDLRSLHAYVTATGSRDQADDLLDRLLDRVAGLEHFPLRGSIPKELDLLGITEFRQVVSPPYRLIYYIADATVAVVLIADGRRDMAALLKRRLLGR
jgi:toxin ParE1/3/4